MFVLLSLKIPVFLSAFIPYLLFLLTFLTNWCWYRTHPPNVVTELWSVLQVTLIPGFNSGLLAQMSFQPYSWRTIMSYSIVCIWKILKGGSQSSATYPRPLHLEACQLNIQILISAGVAGGNSTDTSYYSNFMPPVVPYMGTSGGTKTCWCSRHTCRVWCMSPSYRVPRWEDCPIYIGLYAFMYLFDFPKKNICFLSGWYLKLRV